MFFPLRLRGHVRQRLQCVVLQLQRARIPGHVRQGRVRLPDGLVKIPGQQCRTRRFHGGVVFVLAVGNGQRHAVHLGLRRVAQLVRHRIIGLETQRQVGLRESRRKIIFVKCRLPRLDGVSELLLSLSLRGLLLLAHGCVPLQIGGGRVAGFQQQRRFRPGDGLGEILLFQSGAGLGHGFVILIRGRWRDRSFGGRLGRSGADRVVRGLGCHHWLHGFDHRFHRFHFWLGSDGWNWIGRLGLGICTSFDKQISEKCQQQNRASQHGPEPFALTHRGRGRRFTFFSLVRAGGRRRPRRFIFCGSHEAQEPGFEFIPAGLRFRWQLVGNLRRQGHRFQSRLETEKIRAFRFADQNVKPVGSTMTDQEHGDSCGHNQFEKLAPKQQCFRLRFAGQGHAQVPGSVAGFAQFVQDAHQSQPVGHELAVLQKVPAGIEAQSVGRHACDCLTQVCAHLFLAGLTMSLDLG